MGVSGQKIGFFPGVWDLVHAGHIRALKEAYKHCDYLIVGLQVNPKIDRPSKNKPILSWEERYEILSALSFVDWIWIYETEDELRRFDVNQKIHIRFMGDDHKKTNHKIKAKIHYINRSHGLSSTELRERIKRG